MGPTAACATTTAVTAATAASQRLKKKWIAKCPENQAALDRLAQHREGKDLKDRYAMTLKKAMESLQHHPDIIATFKDAKGLKYVGDHIASLICPPQKRLSSPGNSSCSSTTSSNHSRALKNTATTTNRTAKRNLNLARIPEQHSKEIGKKQKIYDDILATANDWKRNQHSLQWRVVLLVDGREPQHRRMVSACAMSGIPCEVRNLPISDMGWIAQGILPNDTIATELVLGTLVERKTPEDLKSSLFGTRYQEQRLRLQHSGIPQILFLIEGELRDLSRCPLDTLLSAVWETRLHKDFSVVQTEDMTGTVRLLKRIHRRILQRTFPQAFAGSIPLPMFMEATSSHSIPGQRRPQSLAEMTFDTIPVPCLGLDRFITYNELKAKVERDREAGTRTVRSIHLAMLKQVPTFSNTKCQAIAQIYPTPRSLLSANLTVEGVASIPTKDPKQSQKMTTIGEKSARELILVYGNSFELPPQSALTKEPPVVADDLSIPSATQMTKKTVTMPNEEVVARKPAAACRKADTSSSDTASPYSSPSVGDSFKKTSGVLPSIAAQRPAFTSPYSLQKLSPASLIGKNPADSLHESPDNLFHDFSRDTLSSTQQRPGRRSSTGFPSPNDYFGSPYNVPATATAMHYASPTTSNDGDDDDLRIAIQQSTQHQSNTNISVEEQQEVALAIQRSLQDQKKQRRVLNTSVGSLLDDTSSEEEEVLAPANFFRKQLKPQPQEVIEID